MKKALILGAGFSGLSAAAKLGRVGGIETTLVDARRHFNFLPLLPDVIGRGITPENLIVEIEPLSRKLGCGFVNSFVREADLAKKLVKTRDLTLEYDFLVIATGTETNFYGNNEIARRAYKLDNLEDAERIRMDIEKRAREVFLIAGGGYTGVEVAANLARYCRSCGIARKIVVLEKAPSLLGPLPAWMKSYAAENLKRMGVHMLFGSTVQGIDDSGTVHLSSGQTFNNAMLIWAAGVKTPSFIQDMRAEKNPQGRLSVDPYLRINENCFAAGDSAFFSYKNSFLRMAVQFAIAQGACAAENVINSVRVRPLRKYRPRDFGYIIPMANNFSCGNIFGVDVKGKLATLLHYSMCVFRSIGLKNKQGLIIDLLKKGGRLC